jgi:hypothetical protein
MWTRFLNYLSAVITYWQFWVAVAFFAERVVERFFPKIWRWAEPHLSSEHRRKLFVCIAIIAFVYSNFRAFDSERSRDQTAAAQLRYKHAGTGDPLQSGKSFGLRLSFINGGSLPSIGLIFEHRFEVFDHSLTDADKRREMAKVKQTADKRRTTLTDSEIQPDVEFSLQAGDPDDILLVRKERADLTHYLFAVLEYKDRVLAPDEVWVTEVCLEMSSKGTGNCSTANKIYRSN